MLRKYRVPFGNVLQENTSIIVVTLRRELHSKFLAFAGLKNAPTRDPPTMKSLAYHSARQRQRQMAKLLWQATELILLGMNRQSA